MECCCSWRLLQAFSDAFAVSGFRPEAFAPAYGLAESVILVTNRGSAMAPPHLLEVQSASLSDGRQVIVERDWLCGKGAPSGRADVTIVASCGLAAPRLRVLIRSTETGCQLPDLTASPRRRSS